MTRPVVVIDDTTTRAEIAVTLSILNADAKAMSRRGRVGTLSAEYARQHQRIDAVLADWLARP